MRKLFLYAAAILGMVANAYAQQAPLGSNQQSEVYESKYQIYLQSMPKEELVKINSAYQSSLSKYEDSENKAIGTLILGSLANTFVQKTANASSNLIDLGISYLTESIKKNTNKNKFNQWYQNVTKANTFNMVLAKKETIEDFYYSPSSVGALDPSNIKFNGFVCQNVLTPQNKKGANEQRKAEPANSHVKGAGANTPNALMEQFKTEVSGPEVFYIKCSLRTDSLGLAHMTNHSKFYLKVDTLRFYPKLCNLPNDSTNQMRKKNDRFSFDTRKDLRVQLNVKVYSSWVNQAIMYTNDQQLGEFTISTTINKEDLNEDSLFVYVYDENENNPKVTIEGESFIVPRSYVGSSQKSLWGTGQYRLDMVLTEQCSLNMDYYAPNDSKDNDDKVIPIAHVGNTEQAVYAAQPGNTRWKKDVWKAEWRQMKSRKKGDSFWKNAGNAITTAYIGGNWIKEIASPVSTVLIQEETTALSKVVKLDKLLQSNSSNNGSVGGGAGAAGGAGNAGNTGGGTGISQDIQGQPTTGNGQMPEGGPAGGGPKK